MKKSQQGFTLLELLLVVGIAAILIIAGITTFSLVNKSNQVNETVRLINLVLEQTRKLNSGQSVYAAATDYELALVNNRSVPQKFISGNNVVSLSYTTPAAAVAIVGGGADTFTLTVEAAGRSMPEIAANFDPRADDQIVRTTACGLDIDDADPATTVMSAATLSGGAGCNADTETRIVIQSR